MPLPASVTLVPIHGKILRTDANGTPAIGSVAFVPPQALRDTTGNAILGPTRYTVALDAGGEFTISLPATDDPDITPSGWTYTVVVNTDAWADRFEIEVPAATVGTLEFADIAPAVTPTAVQTYALVSHTHATYLPISGGTLTGELNLTDLPLRLISSAGTRTEVEHNTHPSGAASGKRFTAGVNADAGSNWELARYNDSGVGLGVAIGIERLSGNVIFQGAPGSNGNMVISLSGLGFFGAAPGAKPTVAGSRGGNAALASLLSALAGLGLITDSTTA